MFIHIFIYECERGEKKKEEARKNWKEDEEGRRKSKSFTHIISKTCLVIKWFILVSVLVVVKVLNITQN